MNYAEKWDVDLDKLDDFGKQIIEELEGFVNWSNEDPMLDWYNFIWEFEDIYSLSLGITLDKVIECLSNVNILIIDAGYNSSDYTGRLSSYRWIDFLSYFPNLGGIEIKNEDIQNEYLDKLSEIDLNFISIKDCNLTSFPEQLIDNKYLKNIDLSYNNIKTIPDRINELEKLNTLILKNNSIRQIHPSISLLENLKHLSLKNNEIQSLRDVSFPLSLEKLDLSYNNLFGIVENVLHLPNLRELNISNNNIIFIGSLIDKSQVIDRFPLYEKLETLDLSNNLLLKLSFKIENLENKTNLKCLDLSNTLLTEFPENFFKLINLESLQLKVGEKGYPFFYNYQSGFLQYFSKKIEEIADKINIPSKVRENYIDIIKAKQNIESFYDYGITKIPEKFILLNKLSKFSISGHPLKSPPVEISDQGVDAIRDFFNNEKVENNEIKLILLGNSTVGKSSYVKFLENSKYDEKSNSTHGIKVSTMQFGNLNVNIWDFGGQEYYHATHRLFLTPYSMYLLFWEIDTNKAKIIPTSIFIEGQENPVLISLQHYDYYYWLETIRKYTGSFPKKSPLFLIQNKIDKNERGIVDSTALGNYSVNATYAISLKNASENPDNKEFSRLQEDLLDCLEKTAKGIEIQKYIARIRKELKNKQNENYWSWEKYRNFCTRISEISDKQIKILTTYLHNTGSIIYYGLQDDFQNSILKDYVFINPNYITSQIYKILDYTVLQNEGSFTREHIISKLGDEETSQLFIELMKSGNFELIFEVLKNDITTFYAVQYFPEKFKHENILKTTINNLTELCFTLHFQNYFSANIFERFLIKYGPSSDNKLFWKYGIVFNSNDVNYFVKCEFEEKKISVYTNPEQKRSNAVKEIFDTFFELSDYDDSIAINIGDDKNPSIRDIKNFELLKYHFVFRVSLFNGVEGSILIELLNSCRTILDHAKSKRLTKKDFTPGEGRENAINNAIFTDLKLNDEYTKQEELQIGVSTEKNKVGKIDIAIFKYNELITLIEALIHRTESYYITHFKKLVENYNPEILGFVYLVSYYEGEDFINNWNRYLNWIKKTPNNNETEDVTKFSNMNTQAIKLATSVYYKEDNVKINVYHIFIKFP